MHFDIDATGTVLPIDTRAYLEYRLFSVLSRTGADVFAVSVRLRDRAQLGRQTLVNCHVRVIVRPAGEAVVEATADWLHDAIDQAAGAAGAAVGQLATSSV